MEDRSTTTTTTARPGPFGAGRGRRGVAMLMVVIALVVTTVLTTAVLTAPDRLGPVATNKSSSASAHWSAVSASNYTVAAIESELSADAAGGMFRDGWTFAGGDASAVVSDTKGGVPTSDDRSVIVTVTSNAGGIERTVQRRVRLYEAYDAWKATDPRMPEFAVYVTEELLAKNSKIATWWASEESRTSVARLGLAGVGAGRVTSAGLSVQEVVVDEGAHSSLQSWAKETAGVCEPLPLTLPVAREEAPTLVGLVEHVVAGATDLLGGVLNGALGARVTVAYANSEPLAIDPGRYDSLNVRGAGRVVLRDGDFAFDSVDVSNGGTVVASGDVRLVVDGTMSLTGLSQVVLEDGATLSVWIGEELYVEDSVIGPWDGLALDAARGYKNVGGYTPASRLVIDAHRDASVRVGQRSIVFGDLHAPSAAVSLDASMVVGRVSAGGLSLVDSCVLYDPAFDSGYGYANPEGPLYQGGVPIAELDAVLGASDSMEADQLHDALASALNARWKESGMPAVSASGYARVDSSFVPVEMLESEDKTEELYELMKVRETFLRDSKAVLVGSVLEDLDFRTAVSFDDDDDND